MKLFPMTCGEIELDASFATPGHNHGAAFRTAVGMFLAKHERGLVLIDTGNHPFVAKDAAAYWGKDVTAWVRPRMAPDDAVDKQIEKLGFNAADVSNVVLTHMHIDHAGGMGLFPDATFHIQEKELLAAMWPDPRFDRGFYEVKDFACSRRFRIERLDGDFDLFGDGSVRLIKTGGHSGGHQMALLRLPKTGAVLLPGDAAFMPQQLELSCLPGEPIPDPRAALAAMKEIRRIRGQGAKILFSHPVMDEWNTTVEKCYE